MPEKTKTRRRRATKAAPGIDRYFFFPINQSGLNRQLEDGLRPLGWEIRPYIIDPAKAGPRTRLAADFKKGRLQVEVQFGNMARWYSDAFKFQLSFSLDDIDVAILVVPMQGFANLIDENVASYERVVRELPWARMSLTVPILVIGLEPDDFRPIRARYNEAGTALLSKMKAAGKSAEIMPFDRRIREAPAEAMEMGVNQTS